MKDCVFCKITRGELLCRKIYEDNDFLAFLDIAPFTEGHTQVIPKKHYRWVWDLPAGNQETPNIGRYFSVVQKIVRHYQRVTNSEWVTGIVWGILVPHAHIQILPNPHKLNLHWKRGKLTKEKGEKLICELAIK
ncbi:MAG TPA: HIT domain-containing protein [Candidatus Bathyarchaeia archaeon]|nr:HIT domain-containing protein [Candidatus Bathyarchaeia archaeon]